MSLITQTINDALVEIGVLNPIDEASPQDHSFALRKLNMIIDSYNTQNLTIPHIQDIPHIVEDVPQIIKTPYIDIGTGETWDMVAPVDIQALFWRQDGKTDYHSEGMSIDQWTAIRTKNIQAIPTKHYIQKKDNNSIRIYFNCIPIGGLTLHLMAKKPYEGVNGQGKEYIPTDNIEWGRGFEKMLTYRLAIELASSYQVEITPVLLSLASEAENNLKTSNFQNRTLKTTIKNRNKKRYTADNRARY